MRVYYFALALCAALAGATITASEPADSAIPLGSVHDAAKHQDGVHLERLLVAAEATDHEARSSMGEWLVTVVESMATKVKAWAGLFAQHASMEQLVSVVKAGTERLTRYVKFKLLQHEFKSLYEEIEKGAGVGVLRQYRAERLVNRLTVEEVDVLAELYMYRGDGETPDAALANALAGTYGDKAMVYALLHGSRNRPSIAGTAVGKVQSAMIGRWKADDYDLKMMIRWISEVFIRFPDHDFFHPAVLELLNAVCPASSPDNVYKALFDHFGNSVRRLAGALSAAANSDYHDHEAVRKCADWLMSVQYLYLNWGDYALVWIGNHRVWLTSFEGRPGSATFLHQNLFAA
uniref:RxLR effector candidate protein n=1 Tax=Peronospora matthiolae TaxID=2874970 RepID=A0AAV1TKH0_9STRA